MKWLALISGELPNSAKYFLSFANVSTDDIAKVGCRYGGPSDDFQPWGYKHRMKIAKSVEKFKGKLTQKQLVARTKVQNSLPVKSHDRSFSQYLGRSLTRGLPSHCT